MIFDSCTGTPRIRGRADRLTGTAGFECQSQLLEERKMSGEKMGGEVFRGWLNKDMWAWGTKQRGLINHDLEREEKGGFEHMEGENLVQYVIISKWLVLMLV